MMIQKVMLVVCLSALLLLLGCQEKHIPASLEKSLKLDQKNQLQANIAADYENWDARMTLDTPIRDVIIARDPSIERPLYLAAVDEQGQPVECDRQAFRVMVDIDGKLILRCQNGDRFAPVAVNNDQVVVEKILQ